MTRSSRIEAVFLAEAVVVGQDSSKGEGDRVAMRHPQV